MTCHLKGIEVEYENFEKWIPYEKLEQSDYIFTYEQSKKKKISDNLPLDKDSM